MKNIREEKGQTTIELALIMMLLLVLFFGIAEIARAWWLKNQINNAARVAVRVAIVTKPLSNISAENCSAPSSPIVTAACNSITNSQLHDAPTTTVELTTADTNGNGTVPDSGDEVIVTVKGNFVSVVPNLATLSFGLFPASITMSSDASMRYE